MLKQTKQNKYQTRELYLHEQSPHDFLQLASAHLG